MAARPRPTAVVALALVLGLAAALLWPRRAAPPVEVHSWRQALAANVARGYRCGAPFLAPRVDACAAAPGAGISAMEFPGYAWLMARAAGPLGAHGGERAVALVAALLLPLALFLLARRLLGPLGPAARDGGALLAAALPLGSPLFLAYGGALLPDVPAHALALAGAAAVLAGAERGRRTLLAAGSLLLSAGVATKLAAAPVLALTGAALGVRLLRAGPARRAAALDLALHLALVAALPLAWYRGWNPVLAASDACRLFWLDPSGALRRLGADAPLRAFRGLVRLAGAPAAIGVLALWAAGLRGAPGRLPIAALALAATAMTALLGWHAEIHEYDALVLLAPAALAAGAGLAAILARLPRAAGAAAVLAPAALLAAALPAARAGLAARERPEAERFLLLGHELDLALPPGEPLLTPFQVDDPRIGYFAARATWNLDGAPDCARPAPVDCALVLWGRAPACARAATSVIFPDRALTCGLAGGRVERVAERLAARLHGTPRDLPGNLGRFLGWSAAHRAGGPAELLLFFRAAGGDRDRTLLDAGGRAVEWPFPPPPRGAIAAVRVRLDRPGPFAVRLAGAVLRGETADAGAVEDRCVSAPAATGSPPTALRR